MFYPITPIGKPRMTQRDKWKKRPVVERYYLFKDECRRHNLQIPLSGAHLIFYIEMPKSWSKKKKAEMINTPHQQRPDWDNLAKACCDAVYDEDSTIWDIRVSKFWSDRAGIAVNRY